MLTQAEQRYDQNSRESLAIVWATEYFHYYLLGRDFTVMTDSRGAISLMTKDSNEKSKRVLQRTENWRYRMEIFNASYRHITGAKNIADCTSRLAELSSEPWIESSRHEIASLGEPQLSPIFHDDALPLSEVFHRTQTDPVMKEIFSALESDVWPRDLRQYELCKESLSNQDGYLLKFDRIVLPIGCRAKALRIAHAGHPGMTTTKKILRERVWWPGLNTDVEDFIERCAACELMIKKSNVVPMARTIMPRYPWERLAMDHFGPIRTWHDNHVLVVVDYHSRFLVTRIVKSTGWDETRLNLEDIFDQFGYPVSLRSDNSSVFRGPLVEWGIQRGVLIEHSTPYNPQQNGMAEAAMKIVNKALTAANISNKNYAEELKLAGRAHNSAPHSVSGLVPEEALFGRRIRRGLPSLRLPNEPGEVEAALDRDAEKKEFSKIREDALRGAKPLEIFPGDVVVCISRRKSKLTPTYGNVRYNVLETTAYGDVVLSDSHGKIFKRSGRDVKKVLADLENDDKPELVIDPHEETSESQEADQVKEMVQIQDHDSLPGENELRRSSRLRKKPDYLSEFVSMIVDEVLLIRSSKSDFHLSN